MDWSIVPRWKINVTALLQKTLQIFTFLKSKY